MPELYGYQHKGVEHLLSQPWQRPHALLADAPGTGKTIVTIEAAKQANCKTGVILCPSIIKPQWARQMVAWNLCDEDEIQVIYGTKAELTNQPWVVINYDLIREEHIRKQLAARQWHVLVMDEAHRLKTHGSKQTNAVFHKAKGIGHSCYYKWALSGSIMPNRPAELYPILKTMAPEVLGKYDTWDLYQDHFCGGRWMMGKGSSNIAELTANLQPFMLRRELADVWREMPPIIENVVYVNVPFRQHPEWTGDDTMQDATERRIVAEAKIPAICEYVEDRLTSGVTKIAVITYHRSVTEGVAAQLSAYHPAKIYGGITLNSREANLRKFLEDPDCRLICIQIASGGEGLDGLQHVCAEYVQAEPEWSPGREDQAGRRFLRLGQTKTVIATQLIAAGSYEDAIYGANQRKRKVIEVVLKPNGGNFVMSIEANVQALVEGQKECNQKIDLLIQAIQSIANAPALPAAAPTVAPSAPLAPPAPVVSAPVPQVGQQVAPPPPLQLVPPPTPAQNAAATSTVIPGSTTPAPTAPSAPTPAPAGTDDGWKAFEATLLGLLGDKGDAGVAVFQEICNKFSVARPSELKAEHRENFLAHVKHALGIAA